MTSFSGSRNQSPERLVQGDHQANDRSGQGHSCMHILPYPHPRRFSRSLSQRKRGWGGSREGDSSSVSRALAGFSFTPHEAFLAPPPLPSSSQGVTPVSPLNGLWAIVNILPLSPTPLGTGPASSTPAPIRRDKTWSLHGGQTHSR